jgi:hypothetical protein
MLELTPDERFPTEKLRIVMSLRLFKDNERKLYLMRDLTISHQPWLLDGNWYSIFARTFVHVGVTSLPMVLRIKHECYVFNVKRLWKLRAFVRQSDNDVGCSTPKGMSIRGQVEPL